MQTLQGVVPALSVSASRKDGALTVSLVNPSLDKDEKITLDWDTIGGKADVSARILTAEKISDFNDFGKEPAVATKDFKDFKVSKQGITFTLPAKAVVNFTIK